MTRYQVRLDGTDEPALTQAEVLMRVEGALAGGLAEVWITDRNGLALALLINSTRAFAHLMDEDGDPLGHASDPGSAADKSVEAFTLSNGQVDEWERSATISHQQVRSVIAAFLESGTMGTEVTVR